MVFTRRTPMGKKSSKAPKEVPCWAASTALIEVSSRLARLRSGDFLDHLGQGLFSLPAVNRLLHAQPDARPVADELADPNRHVRSDGSLLRQDLVQLLPRDLHALCGLGNIHLVQRRKHILPQDRARMSGL